MPENSLTPGARQELAERARIDARLAEARERFADQRICVATFDGSIDGSAIRIEVGTVLRSTHPIVARYSSQFRQRTPAQLDRKLKSLRFQLEWAAGL